MAGFVWGGNTGEKLTPKEVERQRLAAALMARDAGMTTPVASPWAGVNRALQGYLSGRDKRNAGAAETAGMAGADAYVRDNPVLSGLLGGGTMQQSSPVAMSTSGVPVGGDGLPASLVRTESGGNWNALNSEGYGGRGQFGEARLADAARAGIIPAGMTGAEYSKASPEVQLAVENWHKNDILGGLGKYVGTDVDGAGPIPPLTEDSILAVAHLGGTGGAKKFIESGGAYNPADSNGTSLADYAMSHSGGGGMSASGQPIPITGGGSNVVGALASAMSDPWVAEKYGPVLQAMMTQQMGRGDMQLQQQLAQSDPMYQAQLAQLTAPKQSEYAMRAAAAQQYGIDPASPQFQQFVLGGELGGGAEGFTLGQGQQRFDAKGNIIASGMPEAAPVTSQPLTDPAERAKWGIPATDTRPYAIEAGKRPELIGGGGVTVNNAINTGNDVNGNPKVGASLSEVQTGVDTATSLIDNILQDPALSKVTGSVEGGGGNNVDEFSAARRAYYGDAGLSTIQKIAQLQNTAWLAARDMLKGGGAITDYESKKAEGAMARLSRAQGDQEFKAALKELRDAITEGAAKLKAAGVPAIAAPSAAGAAPKRRRYNPATGAFE